MRPSGIHLDKTRRPMPCRSLPVSARSRVPPRKRPAHAALRGRCRPNSAVANMSSHQGTAPLWRQLGGIRFDKRPICTRISHPGAPGRGPWRSSSCSSTCVTESQRDFVFNRTRAFGHKMKGQVGEKRNGELRCSGQDFGGVFRVQWCAFCVAYLCGVSPPQRTVMIWRAQSSRTSTSACPLHRQ